FRVYDYIPPSPFAVCYKNRMMMDMKVKYHYWYLVFSI
ncbi:MAG: hypothetical protein ACI8X3_003133, partial [Saprospiraceae bacterium]